MFQYMPPKKTFGPFFQMKWIIFQASIVQLSVNMFVFPGGWGEGKLVRVIGEVSFVAKIFEPVTLV